jgi:hypothetical protein
MGFAPRRYPSEDRAVTRRRPILDSLSPSRRLKGIHLLELLWQCKTLRFYDLWDEHAWEPSAQPRGDFFVRCPTRSSGPWHRSRDWDFCYSRMVDLSDGSDWVRCGMTMESGPRMRSMRTTVGTRSSVWCGFPEFPYQPPVGSSDPIAEPNKTGPILVYW